MMSTAIGLQAELIRRGREVGKQLFRKYLLVTNVAISASLSCAGDVLQQNYELANKNKNEWDRARTARMTTSGVTVGVLCHYWYQFLDKRLPGRTFKIVMKKVLIDQMVCSPAYITMFFATTCYLENCTWSQFKNEVVQKGWRLFLADWVVWPPAQVINFYILPTRFRVLYDNTISLGYDVYTSYVKNEIPLEGEKSDD